MKAKQLWGSAACFSGAVCFSSAAVLVSIASSMQAPRMLTIFLIFFSGSLVLSPTYKPGQITDSSAFAVQLVLLFTSEVSITLALTLTDPNNAVGIKSTSTILVVLIAKFLLKSEFNPHIFFPLALGALSGIVLIIQPPCFFASTQFTSHDLAGIAFSFISTIAFSLLICFQHITPFHQTVIPFWNGIIILIIFAAPAFIEVSEVTFEAGLILILCGILTAIGWTLCLYGWQIVSASTAGMIFSMQPPLILIFSVISGFEKNITLLKVVGIILVTGCVLMYQWLKSYIDLHRTESKELFYEEMEI